MPAPALWHSAAASNHATRSLLGSGASLALTSQCRSGSEGESGVDLGGGGADRVQFRAALIHADREQPLGFAVVIGAGHAVHRPFIALVTAAATCLPISSATEALACFTASAISARRALETSSRTTRTRNVPLSPR